MTGNQAQQTRSLAMWSKVRENRRAVVLIIVLGTALGVTFGLFTPVRYVSQAKLIAGSTNVSITAVPAFAEAGKSLAETYSRIFLGDDVRKALEKTTGAPVEATTDGAITWRTASGSTVAVTASPIAGSSIILVEASSGNDQDATQGADKSADALAQTVSGLLTNDAGRQQAETELANAFKKLGDARARAQANSRDGTAASDVQAAEVAVDAYRGQLNQVVGNTAQGNGLAKLSAATPTANNTVQRIQLGLVLGLVVAAAVAALYIWLRRPAEPDGTIEASVADKGSPRGGPELGGNGFDADTLTLSRDPGVGNPNPRARSRP